MRKVKHGLVELRRLVGKVQSAGCEVNIVRIKVHLEK